MTLAHFKEKDGKTLAVYPFLKKSKLAGKGHPEETVRLAVYNELLEKYKYPPELLDIEFPVLIREDEQPRWADIVVFDDKAHKRPLIVVEAKEPRKDLGEKQGQRYATILRAVYVLWTNGSNRSTSVIVNRYPEEAVIIKDIPKFGGIPQYTITELEAFKDDKQVSDTFRKCHNLIRNLSNLKPDDAFTEFLKILLVKFQDERKGSDFDFQIFLRDQPPSPESQNETAQRIRLLFKLAVEEDSDIAAVFKKGDDIGLTNDCITQIVKELQRFSFAKTPVDQKGRAFETFLSGDLRRELKEFMTPRQVVETMIEMADPEPSYSILDPCCGSGAFLIYSLAHVRKKLEKRQFTSHQRIKLAFDFGHDKLWGFDASEQMSAVARINMLVNEDGRAHVFDHDSLKLKDKAPEQARTRLFDLVLTNPPFGKRIPPSSSLLKEFLITTDDRGKTKKKGFLTEILFLERNLEWLKPSGYMYIVLPDSVLGNSTLTKARAYIETLSRLVAIVSLSPDTFGPSGAKSKTSFVVLQKTAPQAEEETNEDYPIFIAHVPNVGYDFTGRATGKNDLPNVIKGFNEFKETGKTTIPLTRVVSRQQLGATWLAQPHIAIEKKKETKGDVWTLGNICKVITTGKTAPRGAYTNSGVHMIKVGNLTGRGIEWDAVERQYVTEEFANKYSYAQLKKGDILFTAAAHGPKWIGLKVDIYEGAPSYLNEPVIFSGEIMMCRLDKQLKIDPYYILLFLRSAAGYHAIQRCIRGQSGHIYPNEVRDIEIPLPARLNSAELKRAMNELKAALRARRLMTSHGHNSLSLSGSLFPSDSRKPIIAR